MQRRVLSHAANSEFDQATVLLHSLQKDCAALLEAVAAAALVVEPLHCLTGREISIWTVLLRKEVAALLAVGGIVALVFALGAHISPRRRKRPKVNID